MMQVIVMEPLLKNKLVDASLPIAGSAQRAAIIATASRRLIHPERTFAEAIPINMSFATQEYFV
jgi:hypothetical protein